MNQRLVVPLSLLLLAQSQKASAYCYYDSYNYYYCNSVGLAIGARIGIAVAVLAVCAIISFLIYWRRRQAMLANNTILLQHQQQQPAYQNQYAAPPGGAYPTPGYGQYPNNGYPNNGYPMYPQNTGAYPGGEPKPFQPGYNGGYGGGEAPKGYDVNTSATPIQEPARAYNPGGAFTIPPASSSPAPGAPTAAFNEPPSYSGYNAPPPQAATAGGTSVANPYVYNPPDTRKV